MWRIEERRPANPIRRLPSKKGKRRGRAKGRVSDEEIARLLSVFSEIDISSPLVPGTTVAIEGRGGEGFLATLCL